MVDQPAKEETTPLGLLGQAFRFTGNDLSTNRTGHISPEQRRQLIRSFIQTVLIALVLLIMPIVIGLALVLWSGDLSLRDTFTENGAYMGYLVGLLLSGFYSLVNLNQLLLFFDALDGRARSIRGAVQKYGLYVVIRDRRFLLNEEAMDLIQDNLHYKFYFTVYAGRILSVEFAE